MDRQQLCLLGAGVSAFGPLHSKADIPFSPQVSREPQNGYRPA